MESFDTYIGVPGFVDNEKSLEGRKRDRKDKKHRKERRAHLTKRDRSKISALPSKKRAEGQRIAMAIGRNHGS